MLKSIYLDVCALCRPYDDQTYMRIHLETTAVNMILTAVHHEKYSLVCSPVHFKEIEAISEITERLELTVLLTAYGNPVSVNLEKTRTLAESYIAQRVGIADAAHVAFAELANADFISCDNQLMKRCQKLDVNIWVGNPVAFCEKEGMGWMSYGINPKKN